MGRKLITVAIVFFLLFIMLSCNKSDKTIKIGYLGVLQGKFSDWGQFTRDGVIFHIEKINDSGGINGREIELVIKDSFNYTDDLSKALDEFVEEGISIILGPILSSNAVKIALVAEEKGVLLFSPTASTNNLLDIDDFFIRSIHTDRQIAYELATFLYEQKGWKNITSVFGTQNRANSEGWHNALKKKFEEIGGKVNFIGEVNIDTDSSGIVDKMLKTDFDGIFISCMENKATEILQDLYKKQKGVSASVYSGAATVSLITNSGKAAEGMISAKPYSPDPNNTEFLDISEGFLDRFGYELNYPSRLGYDSIVVLSKALITTGKNDAKTIKETIISIKEFDGPMGKIIFNEFGDTERIIQMFVVEDSKYTLIKKGVYDE